LSVADTGRWSVREGEFSLERLHIDNLADFRLKVDVTLGRDGFGREAGMERVRWEYRIINIRSENYRIDPAKESELNALGEQGWELVAITAINYKTAATDHIGMVFKRVKA
jgi:hypothetical protein